MVPSKCGWCGEADGELRELSLQTQGRFGGPAREERFRVHPEHEAAFRAYHERTQRYGRAFLALVVAVLVAAPIAEVVALILGAVGVGIMTIGVLVVVFGAALVALPIATPETVAWLGARRSVTVVRWCGVVIVLLGTGLGLLGVTMP